MYENNALHGDQKTVTLQTQAEIVKEAYINDDDVINHGINQHIEQVELQY